jgi:tetratricopeptide (TPR) repeat protein
MMNIRQRSVNVSRQQLLVKLKENLLKHQAEYQEALIEFHKRLIDDLKLAHKQVSKVANVEELKDFSFKVSFPQNHEKDYAEVIEMLEMSVDESINLDSESFRAYVKNEWSWQKQFLAAKAAYSIVGSSFNG